jgi:phosphoribosylformylglycinamidine synthase
VLGDTHAEMGGSEYLALRGRLGATVPRVDAVKARALYERLSNAIAKGLVASCHDCSDGGLGVALAESAFAGDWGMKLDLRGLGVEDDLVALFSESQSRFVVTIAPENRTAFEAALKGSTALCLGAATSNPDFMVNGNGGMLMNVPLAELKEAWQKPLRW